MHLWHSQQDKWPSPPSSPCTSPRPWRYNFTYYQEKHLNHDHSVQQRLLTVLFLFLRDVHPPLWWSLQTLRRIRSRSAWPSSCSSRCSSSVQPPCGEIWQDSTAWDPSTSQWVCVYWAHVLGKMLLFSMLKKQFHLFTCCCFFQVSMLFLLSPPGCSCTYSCCSSQPQRGTHSTTCTLFQVRTHAHTLTFHNGISCCYTRLSFYGEKPYFCLNYDLSCGSV